MGTGVRVAAPETTSVELRRAALIVSTLSAFLTPFAISSVNVALPAIGREFGMDAISLSWVATIYLLTSAMFLVPFGKLADIHGRKKVFVCGTLTFAAASLLVALANSPGLLIAGRALQGFGSAMIFGTGISILTSVYPPGERGRVLGITVTAVYLGASCGPFFGGLLTQYLGWRSIFLINVPAGLLLVAVTLWKLIGEWAGARGDKFDFVGSAIYSAMLLATMYGFSLLPNPTAALPLLIGVGAMVLFVRWELKVDTPVVDLRLFRHNRTFAFSNLAALLNYAATFAVSFLLSLYLQYVKGLSPQSAGLVLVVQPIVQAVFSPFAGRLSDRVEPRVVASIGMVLTVAGVIPLAFLDTATGLWFIVADLMVLGLGFALFSSPNMNAIMGSVEKRYYGVASAMQGTMRLIGQMLSMGITMLVIAVLIGRVEITPAAYASLLIVIKVVFVVSAVLCGVGTLASLMRGNLRDDEARP